MCRSAGIMKPCYIRHNDLIKHIEHFNEQGEWLFFRHVKFPLVKSREEVLDEQSEKI